MTIDVIVFSQEELDRAVCAGNKSICLCDGVFLLPDRDDITYTQIGTVTILPSEGYNPSSVTSYVTSYVTLYVTSYITSYITSYVTSYMTSYRYEYEYEYRSSFSASFTSSYVTSYSASFVTSFASSYAVVSQTSPVVRQTECIVVHGYGSNLI